MNKKTTSLGSIVLLIILGILSLIFGEDFLDELSTIGNNTTPPSSSGGGGDWYEIYFTSPTCPPAAERSGGVDETIAADLLTATTQVDVAAFDLDSEPITNALIELRKRNVTVRVVTDTDNADLSTIRRLRRNGISVVEDKRSALMHNKFIVVDGRYVWMGSMNFTTNGVYCNNNNIVRFDSPTLAVNYTVEMDEMVNDRMFGPTSPDNTPNEQLTIQGVSVENYFGPEKQIVPIITNAIMRAQSEILFMAFSFTENQIGEAMFDRIAAGAQARGVFETTGSNTSYSYYPVMKAANLPNLSVRTDGNPRIMHHKVIIIDRRTVIFGSFNFSDNANRRNDENIVIVHDPTFAAYFIEEFEAVWSEARP